MLHPSIFGGTRFEKNPRASPDKTFLLRDIVPEAGGSQTVSQVFAHFQNLNLRVLIEDLRRGQVTRGNWSFANDLCPLSHGMPNGQAISVLAYLSQAVDLPRACRRAALDMGVPSRFIERFVQSWDKGTMSHDWLLDRLEAIWAERQADADTVQCVIAGETS